MPPTSTTNAASLDVIQVMNSGDAAALQNDIATADRPSLGNGILSRLWIVGLIALAALLLLVAWLVIDGHLYTAGDAVGYNLGLVGGIAMLILLLYPLRKRMRLLSRWGMMNNWFRYHMTLGIAGPMLIVFHTTFRIGSMNARVALYSMLLVFASGIIGRFVYRHIHAGMYGRRMTLAEAEGEQEKSVEDMGELLGWVPEMGTRLTAFKELAFRKIPGTAARTWRFITLRQRGRSVRSALLRLASSALKQTAQSKHWGPSTLAHYRRQAGEKTDAYISAVCSAAQFSAWERLFRLWHVAHVPFVYLMVICGVVHVVAVHMY